MREKCVYEENVRITFYNTTMKMSKQYERQC